MRMMRERNAWKLRGMQNKIITSITDNRGMQNENDETKECMGAERDAKQNNTIHYR